MAMPQPQMRIWSSPDLKERRSRTGTYPAQCAGHKSRPPVCATPPRPHSSPIPYRAGPIKRFPFRATVEVQTVKTTAGLATNVERERPMAREFKLPDIGEGVHEGEVVKWFVREGDPIKENDPVVEVMTDKVTVQIPSPVTGKVLQLRAKEGEVVKVGATLVVFGEAGETAPTMTPAAAARPTVAPSAPARSAPPPPPPSSGEALAAPAVRRLAKELNVNLGALRGSGPQGRITEDDVRKGAQTPAMTPKPATSLAAPAAAPMRPAAGGEERIPIHGLRKRIFEKM